MKKLFAIIIVATASLAAIAQQPVDIKNVRVGMFQQEFNSMFPNGLASFTIGGVRSKDPGPSAVFLEGRLDRFVFFFDPSGWKDVRDAAQAKYSRMLCREWAVQTRGGIEYTQEDCRYEDLMLSRYASDIDTSVLALESKRYREEMRQKSLEKKNDI